MNKNNMTLAAIAAAAVFATGVGSAAADTFRSRMPGEPLTSWYDSGVTGGGVLRAELSISTYSGTLNITNATSGFYNSQLQYRCQNHPALNAINRNWVLGTIAGDASYTCSWWAEGPMLGIVGWIDDI